MTTITIDRAVVEQALEALIRGCNINATEWHQAIYALRAALAQQAEPVEPVAWWVVTFFGEITEKFQDKEEAENFYRAMQANYPQDAAHRKLITLYTAPPQRKPLTEEEIMHIGMTHQSLRQVVRAVERAHEIKE